MWIKTLDDEIVNTDYIHMIYISSVDYEYNTFEHKWHKWAVRAVVSGEIHDVTLYECENEEVAKYKLNSIMNKFNNRENLYDDIF